MAFKVKGGSGGKGREALFSLALVSSPESCLDLVVFRQFCAQCRQKCGEWEV